MSLVRGAIAGLVGLVLTACAWAAEPSASHPALTLDGKIEQGSAIRGTAMPGAKVTLDGTPLMVDGEGRFVFGFDRDATGEDELSIAWPNGDTETRTLTIAARDYEIQRINGLPEKEVTPPPEALAQIKREAAEKLAARKPDTEGSWFAENFIWPAAGPISGVFGSQRILNGEPRAPHYGVDVAAPEGAPIVAPAGGIVTLAEPKMYFEGGLVFIDHGHGLISYVMHMSRVEVHKGEVVKQGEEIGRVGQTGRATGPHMHWGMFWMNAHVDPQLLVPPMPPSSSGG
jgi:murein DD-endopeptidase MepM/ murein hydrolase activator NlpD